MSRLPASIRWRAALSGRMINRLADSGTAILVTTHYLEEAEQCNRLGLMVAGELVAEGTPSGIKAQQTGPSAGIGRRSAAAGADLLKSDEERWRVSLFGDRLHVITDDDVLRLGEARPRNSSQAAGFRCCSSAKGASRSRTSSSAWWRKRAEQGKLRARMTERVAMRRIFAQTRKELTQILRDQRRSRWLWCCR